MSKSERGKIVKKDTAKISKANEIRELSADDFVEVTGGNSHYPNERPDPGNLEQKVLPESSTLNNRQTH